MKKLSIVLVTIVLCCSAFLFAGCDQAKTVENTDVIPDQYDLVNVAVGTKLPTLHPANFSYQYQKDDKTYTFHIDDFSVELYEKRTIKEGDVITGRFYPYTIKITIQGTTDSSLVGKSCYIGFKCGFFTPSIICEIQEDGSFSGEVFHITNSYSKLFFYELSIAQ